MKTHTADPNAVNVRRKLPYVEYTRSASRVGNRPAAATAASIVTSAVK
jgi:hypothetical protein